MKEQTMVMNWINGNITTARRQARAMSLVKIKAALLTFTTLSGAGADAVAGFLKTGEGWQAACDAK
jgi:hypothetical protein